MSPPAIRAGGGGDLRRRVALCLVAMLLFAVSDTLAKDLARAWDPLQIAWCRAAAALLAVALLAGRHGLPARPAHPGPQILRGLCLLGSTVLMIAALRALPMADATALYFVSPVFVALLSRWAFGERVGLRRWLAIAMGLAGVLVVLRPGPGLLATGAALLPILSAACWAVGMVLTRRLTADGPYATWSWTAAVSFAAATLALPFVARSPDWRELLPAAAMAGLWVAGHGCIVLAYGRPEGSLARLAACSYTYMVWAVALGWAVFGDAPDRWTLLGCGLIALGGLWPAGARPAPHPSAGRPPGAADAGRPAAQGTGSRLEAPGSC